MVRRVRSGGRAWGLRLRAQRELRQSYMGAYAWDRSADAACGIVCHEFGPMWTQLIHRMRAAAFLINEKSEGSGESGPVWLFDNRLTHRTSLNWSGSPLQTCPNRLLYFGSRSSVGLVGFPTDR